VLLVLRGLCDHAERDLNGLIDELRDLTGCGGDEKHRAWRASPERVLVPLAGRSFGTSKNVISTSTAAASCLGSTDSRHSLRGATWYSWVTMIDVSYSCGSEDQLSRTSLRALSPEVLPASSFVPQGCSEYAPGRDMPLLTCATGRLER